MTPHPMRCETCTFRASGECPAFSLDDPYRCAYDWIRLVGCASHKAVSEPVGTDGLTDSEYEHKKLVEEIEILSKSLDDCHKLVKFKSKQEREQ